MNEFNAVIAALDVDGVAPEHETRGAMYADSLFRVVVESDVYP